MSVVNKHDATAAVLSVSQCQNDYQYLYQLNFHTMIIRRCMRIRLTVLWVETEHRGARTPNIHTHIHHTNVTCSKQL